MNLYECQLVVIIDSAVPGGSHRAQTYTADLPVFAGAPVTVAPQMFPLEIPKLAGSMKRLPFDDGES